MDENFISYFSTELVDEIIEKCGELIAASPNEPRFYKDLGNAYLKKGNYSEAADAFQRALRIVPNDAALQICIGQCLFLLQEFEKALDSFRNALTLKPDWPDTYYWLGKTFFETRQLEEAKKHIKIAIEKNPRYQDAIYISALINEQETSFTAAISDLKKVIALNPNRKAAANPFPFDLEVLFDDPVLLDETIRQLSSFLKSADGFADLHFKLGMAFRKKGMKQEALAEFRKALHKNPNYHRARHYYWHWDEEPKIIP